MTDSVGKGDDGAMSAVAGSSEADQFTSHSILLRGEL
jgi:hypothetical protein